MSMTTVMKSLRKSFEEKEHMQKELHLQHLRAIRGREENIAQSIALDEIRGHADCMRGECERLYVKLELSERHCARLTEQTMENLSAGRVLLDHAKRTGAQSEQEPNQEQEKKRGSTEQRNEEAQHIYDHVAYDSDVLLRELERTRDTALRRAGSLPWGGQPSIGRESFHRAEIAERENATWSTFQTKKADFVALADDMETLQLTARTDAEHLSDGDTRFEMLHSELRAERAKNSKLQSALNSELHAEQVLEKEQESMLNSELHAEQALETEMQSTLSSDLHAEQALETEMQSTLSSDLHVEQVLETEQESMLNSELHAEQVLDTEQKSMLNSELHAEQALETEQESMLNSELHAEQVLDTEQESMLNSELHAEQVLETEVQSTLSSDLPAEPELEAEGSTYDPAKVSSTQDNALDMQSELRVLSEENAFLRGQRDAAQTACAVAEDQRRLLEHNLRKEITRLHSDHAVEPKSSDNTEFVQEAQALLLHQQVMLEEITKERDAYRKMLGLDMEPAT